MSTIHRFLPRTLCVCAVLLLLPLSALGASKYSKYAGSYESDQAKPDKPGPSMSLSLGNDGSATFTEDYGKGEQTYFGHWSDAGSQINVTFDPADGQAPLAPMAFSSAHDGLQAVSWDHAAWGKVTPPLMKKTSDDWHNKGHKIF
ncbi:MAG TPA: hypothetical protein VHX11_10115 [Acidobacteriaceae bacterium]|jgi:hypothetical protein|nr:hypothetical protein [Acidobacteriaceae bacterium]